MELQATISALKSLKVPCKVTLFTDSEYLRGDITEWLPRCKANRWRTADRKAVKNDELWRHTSQLTGRRSGISLGFV
jgi:ribonuclease HI